MQNCGHWECQPRMNTDGHRFRWPIEDPHPRTLGPLHCLTGAAEANPILSQGQQVQAGNRVGFAGKTAGPGNQRDLECYRDRA
jgi:hypothetical protein